MKFLPSTIPGVFSIEKEAFQDERGFFLRTFCQEEFRKHHIDFTVRQTNLSYNRIKGTLRGLHYQREPFQEDKLVECIRGSFYDVILDLRRDSPAYGTWVAFSLTCCKPTMIYVPRGCAHGFQTLENETFLLYHMSEFYHSQHATGIRWNDPFFRISWPLPNPLVSDRDSQYPDFERST